MSTYDATNGEHSEVADTEAVVLAPIIAEGLIVYIYDQRGNSLGRLAESEWIQWPPALVHGSIRGMIVPCDAGHSVMVADRVCVEFSHSGEVQYWEATAEEAMRGVITIWLKGKCVPPWSN